MDIEGKPAAMRRGVATGRPAAWVATIHSRTFMCAAAATKEELRGEPRESLERRPLRSSGVMHASIFWRVGASPMRMPLAALMKT